MPTSSRAGTPEPRGRDQMPHKTGHMPADGPGSAPERRSSNGGAAASAGSSASSNDMDRRAIERVLSGVREAGVQQIELQSADVTGAVKTVAVPARRIAAVLADGEWFDGSAIEGLAPWGGGGDVAGPLTRA